MGVEVVGFTMSDIEKSLGAFIKGVTIETAERVLREAARVLRVGGRLVGSDLEAHAHPEAVERYNHQQPGFAPDALAAMLQATGFTVDFCAPTQREARPPHFTVITFHATKATP